MGTMKRWFSAVAAVVVAMVALLVAEGTALAVSPFQLFTVTTTEGSEAVQWTLSGLTGALFDGLTAAVVVGALLFAAVAGVMLVKMLIKRLGK